MAAEERVMGKITGESQFIVRVDLRKEVVREQPEAIA